MRFLRPILCVFALLFPTAYTAAYYATVDRDEYYECPGPNSIIKVGVKRFVPKYRIADESAESFFTPVHFLDRRLRPSFWADR